MRVEKQTEQTRTNQNKPKKERGVLIMNLNSKIDVNINVIINADVTYVRGCIHVQYTQENTVYVNGAICTVHLEAHRRS